MLSQMELNCHSGIKTRQFFELPLPRCSQFLHAFDNQISEKGLSKQSGRRTNWGICSVYLTYKVSEDPLAVPNVPLDSEEENSLINLASFLIGYLK